MVRQRLGNVALAGSKGSGKSTLMEFLMPYENLLNFQEISTETDSDSNLIRFDYYIYLIDFSKSIEKEINQFYMQKKSSLVVATKIDKISEEEFENKKNELESTLKGSNIHIYYFSKISLERNICTFNIVSEILREQIQKTRNEFESNKNYLKKIGFYELNEKAKDDITLIYLNCLKHEKKELVEEFLLNKNKTKFEEKFKDIEIFIGWFFLQEKKMQDIIIKLLERKRIPKFIAPIKNPEVEEEEIYD
ncbi:MAG: hypothetical protein K6C97_07430 [Treponema sp.]|nr:hypothetical protein [Treponema sp.]